MLRGGEAEGEGSDGALAALERLLAPRPRPLRLRGARQATPCATWVSSPPLTLTPTLT